MLYIALVSMVLSVTLFFVARYEYVHGVRIGGRSRIVTDRRLKRASVAVRYAWHRFVELLQRDLLARMLHILSYVALMSVRSIERRLDRLTVMFRKLRKRKQGPHAPRLRALTDAAVQEDPIRARDGSIQ